jgi:transposase
MSAMGDTVDPPSPGSRLDADHPENGVLIPRRITVFVFRSKRADRVKLLVYDGTGLVLIWKRLEGNTFKWPPVSDGVMRLSGSQLAALFDGLDWRRMYATRVPRPKVAG